MAELKAEMQRRADKLNDFPTLQCSVCFEIFRNPRKLSLCSHKFCEECLISYVRELEQKQELTSGVKCPVCRQINPGPEEVQSLPEWVRGLELDQEAIEKMKENKNEKDVMAEICGGCKDTNNETRATKLCIDCQEYLCNNCSQFAHKFKPMQGHTILENDNSDRKIHKINMAIAEYLQCKTHKDKCVRFYHVHEDRFLCNECITENKNEMRGDALVSLGDGRDIEELHINQRAGNLNKRLQSLKGLGNAIINQKKSNEAGQKKQTEVIESRIQDIKQQVIILLDALEEAVREKCKGLAKDYSLTAQNDIESLQGTIGELDFSSILLATSETLGNKRILYVVAKHLENALTAKESEVLQSSKDCGKESFVLETKKLLEDILKAGVNNTEHLAVVNKTQVPVALPTYNKWQIEKHVTFEKVGEHEIAAAKYLYIIEPSYVGFTFLADNSLMFVDNCNDNGLIIDPNFKVLTHGKLQIANVKGTTRPFCVAYMKKGYAVVSFPSHKMLLFLSLELKEILIDYKASYKPKALYALKNGDLAVSWNEPVAFGVLSPTFIDYEEKLYLDRDTNGRIFKSFDFMTVDEWRGHIFQSCKIDMAVYCFNFHGEPKFKYTHDRLGLPGGLELDKQGNIFVCGTTTSTIHILSPEGCLIMLVSEGCPKNPINLRLSSDESRCVVSQANKRTIHVFSVKNSK